MHCTQVQLDEEQMRALRSEAARSGVSVAALIRDAVSAHLSRSESVGRRALAVACRFSSGRHDVAEQHDRELESAYAED